jgi:intracellular septation protein
LPAGVVGRIRAACARPLIGSGPRTATLALRVCRLRPGKKPAVSQLAMTPMASWRGGFPAAYTPPGASPRSHLRLTLRIPDQIMKFLFDLFPIILFFVAFKIWGIFTATAVAIVATLVQIAWVAFRHRKVDPMLWVSLGVVTVFGGATLVLHNDTFIKWKPTVLYWAFSVALIVSQLGFNKNLIEAMMGKQITLPHAIWGKLNIIWAVFFVLLGLVNLFVAYHYTTDQWVNFKLFGATGCLLVFIVGQSLWLSKYMKEE